MGNHEQHYSPAVFRHICRPGTFAFTDTFSMGTRMRTPFVVVHLELSVSYFCIFFLLRIHKQCQDGTPKNIFRPDGHQIYSRDILDTLRDETLAKAGAFDEQEPHQIC